jgi:WD40 repeat protein
MKELIATSGPVIVVALDDHAFAAITVDGNVHLVKLCVPNSTADARSETNDNQNPYAVQAVAVSFSQDSKQLLCAVSRYDKYLSVYSLSLANAELELTLELEPTIVHKTNKRCCALEFADIPSKNEIGHSLSVIIAADLAGDVNAFPVIAEEKAGTDGCDKKVNRLLLGHTASMLTAVKIIDGKIFTADRDEKVRVSSLPLTYNVLGYLLGNEAYVTDIDVKKEKYCVTTSGDCTIRLWDYDKCVELACLDCKQSDEADDKTNNEQSTHIPVRVTANEAGDIIAVIYNEKDVVDLFSVVEKGGSEMMIHKMQSLKCTNPLAISFVNNDLFVLGKEPTYMTHFFKDISGEYVSAKDSCKITAAVQKIALECEITMPESILETDNTGKIKLMKNIKEDGEGFVDHKPWLNGDRVLKMKDKERQRKKWRLEVQLAAKSTVEDKS